MRLSPFHKHLAKLIAQGLPNREIKKLVEISDSRLSVLKHNPLMIREVEKWSQLEDSKYAKAMEVIGDSAEAVAKKLVDMVTTEIGVESKVKAQLGLELLGKVGGVEGYGESSNTSNEASFEETLRLTRRVSASGSAGIDEQTLQQAFIELTDDTDSQEADEEGQVLDIEPLRVGQPEAAPVDDEAEQESPSEESPGAYQVSGELEALLG